MSFFNMGICPIKLKLNSFSMKKILQSGVLFIVLFNALQLFSQSKINIWEDSDKNLKLNNSNIQILPKEYRSLSLDHKQLRALVNSAPYRYSQSIDENPVHINVPLPFGGLEEFIIAEAPIMEETLASQFPEIKTYIGININDSNSRIRFSLSPKGFHGMIRSNKGIYMVQPAFQGSDTYISFYEKDLVQSSRHHYCDLAEEIEKTENLDNSHFKSSLETCSLKKYRLAVAATGEYTQYHGGTVADGLAAIVISINRVNEIFENDLGIFLELVANNDEIVFVDETTDPYIYSFDNFGGLFNQNQNTIDQIIGSDNYDLGHVFYIGEGGSVSGNACFNSTKARARSGWGMPEGDIFDVRLVSHEIGHQFNADHTFNSTCRSNVNFENSVEPGGGTTIMAYGANCIPTVQYYKDPYFHNRSINQIKSYIHNGSGSNCGEIINTSNNPPSVEVDTNYYIIPISTSFILSAEGTDIDGDILSYCWEQLDNEQFPMPPLQTNVGGPLFRSVLPDISNYRVFPNLSSIINNENPRWEVLPSISRVMNFNVTVRDNNFQYGCAVQESVQVETIDNAGPFLVTYPNKEEILYSGFPETIQWEVANTDQAPINCTNVDILLSTDGGYTYPIILASNVANDGVDEIIVPNIIGEMNRIKIVCADNIFFDISNENFEIQEAPTDFFIEVNPEDQVVCNEEETSYSIYIQPKSGFNETVDLSLLGLPDQADGVLSLSTIGIGDTAILTLSNLGDLPNNTFSFEVTGTSINDVSTSTLYLVKGVNNIPSSLEPPSGSENVSIQPYFYWNSVAGINFYEIELATDLNFNNIVLQDTTYSNFYQTDFDLQPYTYYYWRVRANNQCGTGSFSTTYVFQTGYGSYCEFEGVALYEWIDSVSIADLHNSSGRNLGNNDFTHLSANVVVGNNYEVHLKPGYLVVPYNENWSIWIDFNRDGSFAGNENVYYTISNPNVINTTITIPANVPLGLTTMRVVMNFSLGVSPCGVPQSDEFFYTYQYGEYEDYSIIIHPDCEDIDGDFVCDDEDVCLDLNNVLIGTACDDNDPYSSNEIYTEDCGCVGEFSCNMSLPHSDLYRQGALYGITDFPLNGNEIFTWYNGSGTEVAQFMGNPYYSPQHIGEYTLIVTDPDYPDCEQIIGPRIIDTLDGCCELDEK